MIIDFNADEVKNYAGQSDFSPLPTGIYEMVVKNVEERATKNGAESIQFDLVVRNDLDKVQGLQSTNGKYHNRHVFMDNWKRKATNQYDLKGIMSIMYQAGWSNEQIDFPNDVINFMKNKPVKAYIKKETDTYNGNSREINRVAPFNITKSDYHNLQHSWNDNGSSNDDQQPQSNPFNAPSNNAPTVSDDDLPF